MYTMPRSFPRSKRWLAPVSVFVLLLLVSFMGADVGAQKAKKRPATTRTPQQQQSAGANSNTQTAQAKPQKKNITPLKSGETSDGSRITITSDAPLNDYSAYRSGDRYYVVIPEANAPRAAGGMRGRGFEDVQVQKRGNDAILSFKLQPGTNARVSQRFNRLDIELTAPGGKTAAVPTATPKTATPPTATPTPQTTVRPTPQTATNGQQNPSINGNTGQTTNPQIGAGTTNPALTPQGAGGNPAVVYAPTPDANASPGVNPQASPVATPPSEQIAQAQPPTTSQPATTTSTTSSASSTSFGTMLRQNWLVVLIAALVLLSLVMIVAARSRAQRASAASAAVATPARRASRKERRAAKKEAAELEEGDKALPVADVLYKSSTLPKARPLATEAATAIAAVGAAEAAEDEAQAAPVVLEDETKEVAVVPLVDTERVESEVRNVFAGESYDEAVIGATDAGTRQFIATELLSALAGRNVERRERAREAFIKHDYLDESTRQLRTADAPAERAAAARSLGYVQDKSTTPHLVAALDDTEPEVRRAAVESLAELRDPSALQPLKDLLTRERDRKVSRSLIKRAIQASRAAESETPASISATAPATETETVTLEAPAVETTEQPAALADLSAAEVAPALVGVAASSLVEEEVDTEAEEAARREAEAEEARQRAAEEERLRVEAEAQRQAEEEERARVEEERLRLEAEARQREEEEAARLRAAEEERQRVEEARLQAEEEARQQAEAEARARAEEEARQQAAEAARLKAEEEARLAAAAAAQRQAEEEAARLRAEEAERQRIREEAERRQAEEAARLKAEAEAKQVAEEEAARQQAEEEARKRAEEEAARRAEAERVREAEEARQRAEAEAARQRAEAEARQREEEEARRLAAAEAQRKAEEEARLAAEAEARARAEEEAARRRLAEEEAAATLHAEAISPVEHEAAEETLTTEASTLVQPEPFIERNDGTASGWVDVDISPREILSHPEALSVSPTEETVTQESLAFEPVVEHVEASAQESKEIEPAGFSIIGETSSQPTSKEIDYAVTERGIAEFDEFSSVPGGILKRLSSEEPTERAAAVADLARVGGDDSFREISAAFDDPSVEVRNAAARSLFNLNADRAATFTKALRESPPERRRKIGSALASSGLASEAIGQLMGESREKTYDAFSLLFLMSKAGEVQPLMRAIEEHPNNEVRLAVVKLLALSGQQEILPAFRRLAVRGSLPTEVRSAVMEAIYQISSQSPTAA